MTDAAASAHDLATQILRRLDDAGQTIAVAESLTGGLLTSALVDVPGASRTVLGGLVAYATPLKRVLLDVPAELLAREGPVHPEVAAAMAVGVRERLAVDGRAADYGVATTGVAGPGAADGHPAGTAFVGIAGPHAVEVVPLVLDGDRGAIRSAVVYESLAALLRHLDRRSGAGNAEHFDPVTGK